MTILTPLFGYSQRVAVTGDALKLLTLTPNVGVDIAIKPRLTLNIEAEINPFNKFFADNISLKHITVSPEVRYWLRRPFYSHYIGVNALCSSYDISANNWVRNGMAVAVGLGYGYSVILSDRWNIVPSIGFGVGYVSYQENNDKELPQRGVSGFKLMPTRLGVAFTYIID